jgi:hypothetical protein
MATRARQKLKQDGQLRSYISYFQSVMTIGIVNTAQSVQEAEDKAKQKFAAEDLSCGIVGQTPFEISETEPWSPDFAGCYLPTDDTNANMSFNLNGTTREKIAAKLDRSADEVTDEDFVDFVKGALERSLS